MRFQSQLPPQAASHNRYLHSVPRPESRLYNETGSDQTGFTATPAGASQFRFNPVATPKMVLSSEADIDDDEGTQKPILHTPGSVLEKAAKEWASTPVESKKTSMESPNKTTDADQTTPEHIGEVSLDYDPGSETEVDEGDEAEGEAEGDEVEDNKDGEDTQRPFLSSTPNAAKTPIRSSSTTPKAHPQHQTPRSRLSLPIPLPASERPEIDASFTSHDSFSNELEPHFLPTPRKPVGPTLSSSAPAYLPSASSDLDSEIFSSPPPVPPVPSSSAKPAKPANPEKLEGLAMLRNSILGKPSKWRKKDKKAKAKGKEGPPITYRAAVKRAHPGPRGGVEEEEDGDDGDGQESRGKNEHTEELGTKVAYKLKAAYKRASSGPRPAFPTNSDDDDEEEDEDEEELPTRGQKMQSVVVEKMRASQVLQYARNETLGKLEIQQMRMKRKAEMEKDKEIQNKRMKDADEEVQRRDIEENPESSGEEENSEEVWDSDIEIGVPSRTQRAEEEKEKEGEQEGESEKEGEQEEESEKEDTRSAMSLDKASAEAQPTPNQEAVEEIFEDSYKSTIAETQFETQGPLPAARSQSMIRPQRPGFSDDENDDEDIPCAPAMPLSGSSIGSLFGPTPKASGQPAPVSSAAPTVLQPMATANKQPQPEIQVHATPPRAAQHHPHSPIPGSQLSQYPLSQQQQQQQPLTQSAVPSTQPQPQPPQSPSTTRKRPPSSSILTTPPVLKKTKTSPKKTPPSATSLRMAKILDGIPVPGSRRSSEAFGTPRELLLPKRNVMGEVEKAGKDTETEETGGIELDIVMKSPEKIKEMPILDVSPQKKREVSQQSQQGQPNQQITPPPRPPAPPTIKRAERAERAERASSESQIQAQLDAQLSSDIFWGSQQGPESQEQEQGHAEQEQEQQHEPDSQYYSIPRSYDVSDSDEDDDGEDGDQDVSWRSQNVGMVGETTGEITEGVTEDFTKAIQEDITGVTEYTEDTQSSVQQPSQVEKYMEISTEVEVSMEEAEEAISSAEGVSSAKTDAAVEEEEADPMEEDVAHIIQATEAASDNPNAPSFEAPTTTPVLTADLAVELDFAMLQSPPLSPPESPNRSQSDTLTLLAAISDSQIPSDAPNTSITNDASTASDPPGAEPVQPELDSHLRPRRIRVPGYSTFTAEQQAELESRRARWFGIQPGARVRIRSVEKQMEVNERFRAEVAEREEAREREREGIMQNTQGREEREWFKDENTPFKKFVRSWEGLKAVRMEREKAMEVAREEGEVM
ncbi:hypothetical protein FPQ18DRAFT_313814 [Pyronema domesticum]|nr:hypothetical protein FPQ18DRAFT_313814 [Pyronema domesticum]